MGKYKYPDKNNIRMQLKVFHQIGNGMGGIVPPIPPVQIRTEGLKIVKNVSVHNIKM